jgi:hypothetical protein
MKTQVITFSNDKVPVFTEVRNKDYINYGEDNNYPNFLVTLFNRSAKHNAILTAKQLYIAGQGLAFNAEGLPTDKIVSTQSFIDNANPYESLHSVSSKMALDIELFGGCYLHIIKSKDKKGIAEVYHLDYCNLRTNKDNSKIYYSEYWLNDDGSDNMSIKPDQITEYPAYGSKEYEKGKEGVLYYKQYRPNIETYTLPEYIGAVPAIITDAEIANYHRASIQNGFMGGTMVIFSNGVPSDEEMGTVEKQMKKKFTGTDRANSLVIDFVDDPARAPQVLQLTGNDFDKRYDALNKTIQEEIFVGHKVTSPMLFGVRTEGQLGGRNEMATAFQLFQNTYITPKQDAIEVILNELVGLKNKVTFIPIEPVMPEFSEQTLATILTKDEMREIIGRKPLDTNSNANEVNDAINTLSPLVANKVLESMTPNEIRALVSLPAKEEGAELAPEVASDATTFSKFAKDDQELAVFMEFGEPAESYTEVKKIKQVFSVADMDNQSQMFALTTTEKGIIDILKNDDKATADDIAKLLKVKVKEIEDIMTNMMDKGYLDDNLKLTPKGVETKVPDFSELYVKYKYALRFDIKGPDVLPDGRTRPFCKGMIEANRLYTREEINKIGERLGAIYGIPNYDAFTRRGGWYTIPKTEIHSPSCRHIWLQTLVKKK